VGKTKAINRKKEIGNVFGDAAKMEDGKMKTKMCRKQRRKEGARGENMRKGWGEKSSQTLGMTDRTG